MPGINTVSVGNINHAKGFEFYLDSAALFINANTPIKFWIVGSCFENQKLYYGKLQQLASRLPEGSFEFYGPSDDIPSILKAADIYVCSSIHEASPISVWEAMSMEKAIVSTDVGDVKEFIKDGVNGFIVPPADPNALAEKIQILIDDAELRAEFGSRARETAVNQLDISICVRKHIEAYKEVLQS